MFPDPNSNFQVFIQIQALRALYEMFRKLKKEREMGASPEDFLPFKRRFWLFLGLCGRGLSRIGRGFEEGGQRLSWYALHKKTENAPDYYR